MSRSVIDDRTISVVSGDGKEVAYRFRLEKAGDVCTMLIRHADGGDLREVDFNVATLLKCQAEMIEMGLHVVDHKAPDLMLDIEKFHQKYGLEYNGKPRLLPPDLFDFRKGFMHEELAEWEEEQPGLIEALTEDDGRPEHRRIAMGLNQQLDALVDLVYVTLGCAYLQFGPEVFHEAWRRVQSANMKKVRCEKADDSKRGSTFDVIKPEGWEPPDHHDLVKDNAHKAYVHMAEETPDDRPPVAAG